MSYIAAGNTTTTALTTYGDTTGNLVFTTGGANTTALTLSNTQAATFAGAVTITGATTHTGNATFSANVSVAGSLTSVNTFGYKNKLINGNFDFWQRGTTNTLTVYGYTVADRWQYVNDGTLGTGTVFSQQAFAAGQTAVPNNPTYFLQVVYTNANTPSNYIRQRIENVATLSGQTATFSFWAKTTSGTVSVGAQFQQEFGTGGSPSAGVYGIGAASFTATTTWQQFSITTAIPSISGKTIGSNNDSALNAAITFPTGGASGTIQIAQAQVELGSQVTSFDIRFLGTELAMCQRYFYQGVLSGSGCSSGSTPQYNYTKFPQVMRTTPSITWISGGRVGTGTTDTAITGLSSVIGGTTNDAILTMTTGTFGTGGQGLVMYQSPIFSLNAEL